MTFSIVARCPRSGALGMAVASSSPAVAARCAHARAGVGAAASQNITDPALGRRLLDLMALGAPAPDAIRIVTETAPSIRFRQLTAIDNSGRTAVFSGAGTLGTHATAMADGVAAAGNLLQSEAIPARMVAAFSASSSPFPARILAGMRAALEAGGEEGPVHSAGLLVVRDVAWPIADLRIDWTQGDPIAELEQLWLRYEPQLEAYVTRAVDPCAAPSFGVPGDR